MKASQAIARDIQEAREAEEPLIFPISDYKQEHPIEAAERRGFMAAWDLKDDCPAMTAEDAFRLWANGTGGA